MKRIVTVAEVVTAIPVEKHMKPARRIFASRIASKPALVLGLVLAFMASGSIASATVINFDDLAVTTTADIASTYDGLNWSNFSYVTGVVYDATYAPFGSGYNNGVVTSPNVGVNRGSAAGPSSSTSGTISSTTSFDFISGDFTAAWYDGVSLEVQGYKGVTLEYDNTTTVNTSGPTLITFNYDNVTSVVFTSSGGVLHGAFGTVGVGFHNVAMDDLIFTPVAGSPVPEPASLLLLGTGLIGVGCRWRRRTRADG